MYQSKSIPCHPFSYIEIHCHLSYTKILLFFSFLFESEFLGCLGILYYRTPTYSGQALPWFDLNFLHICPGGESVTDQRMRHLLAFCSLAVTLNYMSLGA